MRSNQPERRLYSIQRGRPQAGPACERRWTSISPWGLRSPNRHRGFDPAVRTCDSRPVRAHAHDLKYRVLALVLVGAFAGMAVDALAGGYLDAIHHVELTTNAKGTRITYITWNCGHVGFVTRNPLRHPLKVTKSATFAGTITMTATTYAANGTSKKATVRVKVKGFFGGVGSPANGTLSSAKCAHGKKQKFAAYPANI
jgi:hypothetical protein